MSNNTRLGEPDPWTQLKAFTNARIALGRVGSSLPTAEVLNFGLSHAMARDAVHHPLDTSLLAQQLAQLGLTTLLVHSRAPDRPSYLLRPDWGRQLDAASNTLLSQHPITRPIDVQIVIADGLSALAVERHAAALIAELLAILPQHWCVGAAVIATQARVALADEVGQLCKARLVIMLIGERPGLTSPDSLGVYITYAPKVGANDAMRNCISNIRPQGLGYTAAAHKLLWLIEQALQRGLSGVALKDESDALPLTLVSSIPALD